VVGARTACLGKTIWITVYFDEEQEHVFISCITQKTYAKKHSIQKLHAF